MRIPSTMSLLLGLTLAALVCLHGHGQDSKDKEKPKGKKYALLIGVDEYTSSRLPNLKYAEKDVDDLSDILKPAAGYSTRVLTTKRGKKDKQDAPTAENIRKALKELTEDKTKHDLLLIGVAGHGFSVEVRDPDDKGKPKQLNFFCPTDARLTDVEYKSGRSKTMIGLHELFEELSVSGAGSKILLIDACRSAPLSGRTVDLDILPRPQGGTAALLSCKGGEQSYEMDKLKNGLFFSRVIEGLKGKAKNKTDEVTFAGLTEYVTEKVAEDAQHLIGSGAKQTPHMIANLSGRSPVLLEGLGKKSELVEAEKWYDKGQDYLAGRNGVKKDDAEAVRWFRKSAEQGFAKAMFALGTMYLEGRGVAKDMKEAVAWYRKAADGGEAGAMTSLGRLYATGQGVKKDEAEAVVWYRKAAEKGDVRGMTSLTYALLTGKVVERDYAAALKWGRKAAEQDDPEAMYYLGQIYEQGLGVRRDRVEALNWYKNAERRGHEGAKKKVKELSL